MNEALHHQRHSALIRVEDRGSGHSWSLGFPGLEFSAGDAVETVMIDIGDMKTNPDTP